MPFIIPSIFTAVDKVTSVTKTISNSIHGIVNSAEITAARTGRALLKIQGFADGVVNKIFNIRNALLAAAAIGAGKKIFDSVSDIAAKGDELATTAARIGMTTQAFQELGYAAKLQNIEEQTLTGSLEKLNKNLGELHHGQGALFNSLKKSNPGLAQQLKHAKDTDSAFELISSAIYKLPNQMDRAALATAAFGKSGQQMLNLIGEGPGALRDMREEAQRLGFVLSDEAVAAAKKYDDAHDKLNYTILGLKTTVGSQLMPIIEGYMQKASEWIMTHRELIKEKLQEFLDKVGKAIQFVMDHIDEIKTGLTWFIGALGLLKLISIGVNTYLAIQSAVIWGLRAAEMAVTAAQWLWTAATTAWAIAMNIGLLPLTLIAAGIVVLIALIYTIVKRVKGWGEQWEEITKFMGQMWDVFSTGLKLDWLILKNAFLFFVEEIVLAWKWGQNMIGNISDERYEKDKLAISEARKQRLDAIADTTRALLQAAKDVELPEWKLKLKTSDDIRNEELGEEYQQNNTPFPGRVFKPLINPKTAQNDAIVKQLFAAKNSIDINIKTDNNAKADVTKNSGNIPIKTTSTIQGAIKN